VYDSSSYTIKIENPAGRVETDGVVYVNKAPVIDSKPVIDPDAFKYLPQSGPQKPTSPRTPKHDSRAQVPMGEFVAPYFVIGLPANSKIHEGEPIKLTCQVEGNPKPTVEIDIYYVIRKIN
jgi:hypothetical protein